MLVGTVPMRLIVEPLTLIDISISMYELSIAIRLILDPMAVVLASILPDLLAVAVLHAVEQIAGVDSPIAQRDWPIGLPLVIVDHFLRDSLVVGVHGTALEVDAVGHHITSSYVLEQLALHSIS